MLKGFRDFILRGNVINLFLGGGSRGGTLIVDRADLRLRRAVINAAFTFFITAAVVTSWPCSRPRHSWSD